MFLYCLKMQNKDLIIYACKISKFNLKIYYIEIWKVLKNVFINLFLNYCKIRAQLLAFFRDFQRKRGRSHEIWAKALEKASKLTFWVWNIFVTNTSFKFTTDWSTTSTSTCSTSRGLAKTFLSSTTWVQTPSSRSPCSSPTTGQSLWHH